VIAGNFGLLPTVLLRNFAAEDSEAQGIYDTFVLCGLGIGDKYLVATISYKQMAIHQIDPTVDKRWSYFIERHSKASVFHTVGWLQALRRTYGYDPVVFTTSPPTGELKNGLVCCYVKSRITGQRLVSLPFSDHCELLFDSYEELDLLICYLRTLVKRERWRYLEIRPIGSQFQETIQNCGLSITSKYFLHRLSLHPDLNELLHSFGKDCVQRRIHRAERAGLLEKCGRSEELLEVFYSLFVKTRRRHSLPPIPYAWFRNLIACQGDALEMRLAYKDKIPVAAILTLRFRDGIYYKYGCSDARFNRFGATPWLLWRAIVAGKSNGATEFDMGRTEEENAGLLAFKNHWVSKPRSLVYWKFSNASSPSPIRGWKLEVAKRIFSCLPDKLLTMTGELIYRHIG
jgi:hypothetical protein